MHSVHFRGKLCYQSLLRRHYQKSYYPVKVSVSTSAPIQDKLPFRCDISIVNEKPNDRLSIFVLFILFLDASAIFPSFLLSNHYPGTS